MSPCAPVPCLFPGENLFSQPAGTYPNTRADFWVRKCKLESCPPNACPPARKDGPRDNCIESPELSSHRDKTGSVPSVPGPGTANQLACTKLGSTSINGHGIGMVIVLGGLVMTTISGRSSAHASIPKAISARTAETFSRISGTCTHAAVGAGGGPAGVVKPAEKYALPLSTVRQSSTRLFVVVGKGPNEPAWCCPCAIVHVGWHHRGSLSSISSSSPDGIPCRVRGPFHSEGSHKHSAEL